MNVSPDALRRETILLLNEVNDEMADYIQRQQQTSLSPFQMSDVKGNYGYGNLVASKLLALNTLALLNTKR